MAEDKLMMSFTSSSLFAPSSRAASPGAPSSFKRPPSRSANAITSPVLRTAPLPSDQAQVLRPASLLTQHLELIAAASPTPPFSSHHPTPLTMSISSSSGLPSPTFAPRKLPVSRSSQPSPSPNPGSASSSRRNSWQQSVRLATTSLARRFSTLNEDILCEGDLIGQGVELQGEIIRAAPGSFSPAQSLLDPNATFEVIRKLGTGSYAVVFLVREVFGSYRRNASDDDDQFPAGGLDLSLSDAPKLTYGREFAIKCLSKANLSPEELQVQMFEATVHQSLAVHPNIVTLHRTLETSSFLLLILESVPGEDLFYFLEQSRDHGDDELDTEGSSDGSHHGSSSSGTSGGTAHTPPTPSLLSSFHPSQLLSQSRLKLIASMFSQMCDAVESCHSQGVSHRDIKPENFIVTDARTPSANGKTERRVVVKLSDFGLATREKDSADMECGSAPYMSFECRNNVAPTYATQPADVWSLGIVLINMLYHHNLWPDTCVGNCPTFDLFRADPIPFLLQRSPGMTVEVAMFLANRVFCILDDPATPNGSSLVSKQRVSAKEFGEWAKTLPILLGTGDKNVSATTLSPMSIAPPLPSPALAPIPISPRSPHPIVPFNEEEDGDVTLDASDPRSAILSADVNVQSEGVHMHPDGEDHIDCPACLDEQIQQFQEEACSRTTSAVAKRRKRGARKGRGASAAPPEPTPLVVGPPTPADELEGLVQGLARDISRASRGGANHSRSSSVAGFYGSPSPALASLPIPPSPPVPQVVVVPVAPVPVKKPSKWNVFARKDTQSPVVTPTEEPAQYQAGGPDDAGTPWRGRRQEPRWGPTAEPFGRSTRVEHSLQQQQQQGPVPSPSRWTDRSPAPSIAQSTRRAADESPNWRQSTSTMGSSSSSSGLGSSASSIAPSSVYTRFSNGSTRSVSTIATTASAASNMTHIRYGVVNGVVVGREMKDKPFVPSPIPPNAVPHPGAATRPAKPKRNLPANVKRMDGMPWALDELPRQLHPRVNGKLPQGDIHGGPPVRRKQQKAPALDTISERPKLPTRHQSQPQQSSPLSQTVPPDLDDIETASTSSSSTHHQQPKKVPKGQINALAKILSSLKTSRGRD